MSCLIKPGDITKEFSEKDIQFYGTFNELKTTNCFVLNLNESKEQTIIFLKLRRKIKIAQKNNSSDKVKFFHVKQK